MDKTHRTVHDFSELTYEDIGEVRSAPTRFLTARPYQFLLGALALGVLVGLLAKRK